MIRASSLFYALVVALLLGSLLSGVVLSAHLRGMRTERWLAYNTCRDNVEAAMAAALVGSPALTSEGDSADLFGNGEDPVMTRNAAWGLYDLRTCTAYRADVREGRSALVGTRADTSLPSLYVADHGEPIALAGTVAFHGPCFLPRAGMRRAYIEGRPFQGSMAFEDMRTSGPAVPELPERGRARISGYCALWHDPPADARPWNRGSDGPLSLPIAHPPLVFELGGTATLRDLDLRGPLVLIARDSLVIPRTLTCTGVIICAPFISIEDGFSGDLQCFTTQGIVVGNDVRLAYPSVLACAPEEATGRGSIVIGERARIAGGMIGWDAHPAGSPRVSIELGNEDAFEGELWCNGAVQLHGRCTGNVFAGELLLRTPSSVYRGHLMDIDIGPLEHTAFVGCGLTDVERSGIAVWMDP